MARPTNEERARRQADDQWRRSIADHANHTLHGVLTHGVELIGNTRHSPLVGGRPTLDVQGPDGEWRRYYVRLTEVGQ